MYITRGVMSVSKVFFITVRADVGGSSQHLLTLVTEMKKRGIAPYMAFPDGFPLSEKLKEKADFYINIPHRKFAFISFLKILIKLKRERIRIVHSHGRGASLYSRLLFFFGVNVVHTFHGIHRGNSNWEKLKVIVDRILRPFSHTYICVSLDEKSKALRYSFAKENQIKTINNGICVDMISTELQEVDVAETKKALGVSEGNKPLVGTLARLDPVKNLTCLIRFVFKWKTMEGELPCYFLIAGKGGERDYLLRLIKDYSLEEDVYLLGEIEKPLNFLACLDVYTSCSLSEGLPLSVLEAMSMPLPCLLSNIEGHRCLAVDDGVSLFSDKEFDDFKGKLERLLHDGQYKDELCKRALKTVRTYYGVSDMTTKTLNVYNYYG